MKRLHTTKLSSRGQVVIPKTFREELALLSGDIMIVLQRGDELVFRKVETGDLPISPDRSMREAQIRVLRWTYRSILENEH